MISRFLLIFSLFPCVCVFSFVMTLDSISVECLSLPTLCFRSQLECTSFAMLYEFDGFYLIFSPSHVLVLLFYSLFSKRNKSLQYVQIKLTERHFPKMNAKISLPLLILVFYFLDFLLLSKLLFSKFCREKAVPKSGEQYFSKKRLWVVLFVDSVFEINTTITLFLCFWMFYFPHILLFCLKLFALVKFIHPPFCQNIFYMCWFSSF